MDLLLAPSPRSILLWDSWPAACVPSLHYYIFIGLERPSRLHSLVFCIHYGPEDVVGHSFAGCAKAETIRLPVDSPVYCYPRYYCFSYHGRIYQNSCKYKLYPPAARWSFVDSALGKLILRMYCEIHPDCPKKQLGLLPCFCKQILVFVWPDLSLFGWLSY